MTTPNRFAKAELVLAAAVADDGTFTVAYPTGFSQVSFNAGLAGTGHYAVLNDNDKYANADPGIAVSFDASLITVTNRSGAAWAAGTKVALNFDAGVAGNNVIVLSFPIKLSKVSAADVVTEIRPGVEGYLEDLSFVVTDPATTGSKLATLNAEIGTTNVTGGTVALTSANCTPLGARVQGADITANNRLTRESKLSIEAASVTAFVEGEGVLLARIRLDP